MRVKYPGKQVEQFKVITGVQKTQGTKSTCKRNRKKMQQITNPDFTILHYPSAAFSAN